MNNARIPTPATPPSSQGEILSDGVKKFTVIGAGVIGLLTALELKERGHSVEVVAPNAHTRGGHNATSSIAVGQFLPFVPPEHAENLFQGDLAEGLQELVHDSGGFYEKLSANPELTGVMQVTNLELVSSSAPWPEGLEEAMKAKKTTLEQPFCLEGADGKEATYDELLEFPTYSINARKTLEYLLNMAEESGITLTERAVNPEDLSGLEGVVINATGENAQELDSSKEMVNFFKGHTFVIKPEEGSMPEYAFSVDDLIFMPREDGTVIVGALYIEDPKRPVPEEAEAEELFRRITELTEKVAPLVPNLDPALIKNSQILLHSAGYRVEVREDKEGGLRIAPDESTSNLLHAYGFGGLGWSVGPKMAKTIVDLAENMHV